MLERPPDVVVPSELRLVPEVVHAGRDGPGGIHPQDLFAEVPGNLHAVVIGASGNLVADAPHDDARVVAVAFHHDLQVAFAIFVEETGIVVRVLGDAPLVESLVDDQQAHAVAGIQKALCRNVVRAADCVETVAFEQFGLPFLRTVVRGRTQQSMVVVHASAFQFRGFAIEQEAFFCREFQGPDAERNVNLVGGLFPVQQEDAGRVETRGFWTPELRRVHL